MKGNHQMKKKISMLYFWPPNRNVWYARWFCWHPELLGVENWTGWSDTGKGKFEVLHVGRNSLKHRDRLETSQWEGRSAEHSGLLVDSSLIMRQQCILVEKKAMFFMVKKNIAQKWREVILALCTAPRGYICTPVSSSELPRTRNILTEWSKSRVEPQRLKGLEHFP